MSTEKDNELNEQELWDLLKDHEETEMSKPSKKKTPAKKQPIEEAKPVEEPQPVEEDAKPKTVITERRKKALVWYLVGLFGIAFVVVLLSLFLRGGDGQTPSTDATGGDQSAQVQELYDRINALEDENNALKEEKAELEQEILDQQEMMDGLNLMIDEMSNSLEYVEGNSLFTDENSERLARTMAAYETLVKAQASFIDYDEAELEAAMAELGENLDLLSQDAINAYYMVIEYMEQPYLGQE